MWIALIATAPPRPIRASATGTSSPTGAKVTAASRSTPGRSSAEPAQTAPIVRARLSMPLLAREGVHLAAPVSRHLDREVGRSPETEQAESSSRSDSRQLQGPVADDARAEQRGRFPGRESGRQRIHPARIRREPLRIAAVPVPPGERRRETEVLAAGDAERAASAGRSDPADPDAIAGAETRDSRPDRRDGSRGLVPGDDRKPRRHFSFENVEVRPADAARFDRDLDFPGPRGRRRDLDGEKRRLLGRGRPLEPHGAHRCDSLARRL